MTTPIPQPPSVPFLGNVGSIERDVPQYSFSLLAKTYGEIYQLNIIGAFFFLALCSRPRPISHGKMLRAAVVIHLCP